MGNEITGYVLNPEKIYGKSAYEIALAHGFKGTEEEWLLSLETNSMESIKKLKAESLEEIETKKEEATEHIVSLADDALDVKQTTGNSPTAVMSQEATTKELDALKEMATSTRKINSENTEFSFGKFIWSNGREYESDAFAVSGYMKVFGGENIRANHFADSKGRTIIDFVCEYSTDAVSGFIKRTNIENGGSVILDEETRYIRFSYGFGTETGITLTKNDLSYFDIDVTTFNRAIGHAFLQTLHNRMDATKDNSMDDLTTFGIYAWDANNAPYDCPAADAGVMMVVQFSNQNDAKYGKMAQILYTVYGEFTRYRTRSAWTEWQLKGALVSGDSIKINALSKKCNTAFTPLADVDTSSVGIPTFIAGTKYKGVPYSARHYDSLDVFYNLTLDALFSMFNNPATAIYHYTKERDTGDVFTGGVCSSFVSWVCNLPIYYTTYDIVKMLNYKTINTIEDIEIGDVLICHTTFGDNDDHAMIVSNIIADINGVTAIEIAEMWNPLFRRLIYEPHRFMGLLEGTTRNGQKYRVGRFDNHSIRTVKPPVINSALMSEYGNNVYYELGDDIFVTYVNYHLTLTSPSGEVYDTDDLTIDYETKNDGLYNIGRWFNEVGEWKITEPDGETDEILNIRIIKKGSATLANGRVALSGYEGCAPCGYAVVGIRKGGDGNYDTHLDDTSYTAGRLTIYSKNDPRYAGVLANDTLQFNLDMSAVGSPYVGYYVRVFYETGYGQAFQDTNIQYF